MALYHSKMLCHVINTSSQLCNSPDRTGGASFVDHLCNICLVLLCFHALLFVDALWSPAGKGLTSWLSFVMFNCDVVTFLFGILGQVWCLIVPIPDLCPLSFLVEA